MKRFWQNQAARFDALSVRERVMVFAAAMSVVIGLAYILFLDAEGARQNRLTASIAQSQGEIKALEGQLGKLVALRGEDPDSGTRRQIAEVGGQLAQVEAGIRAEERRFTAPAQMRGVVEGLLARNRAVSLLALRTLPVTSIAEARPAASAAKPAPAPAGKPDPSASAERLIYRHGVEITVAGAYLDLLGYVRDLEALPTQLYWGALEIDAASYPNVMMKLTVYTLSLDRAWLNV
jgi:MSHA biogenesis protein MshJ